VAFPVFRTRTPHRTFPVLERVDLEAILLSDTYLGDSGVSTLSRRRGTCFFVKIASQEGILRVWVHEDRLADWFSVRHDETRKIVALAVGFRHLSIAVLIANPSPLP
jgi:hypothetical protein